MSKILQFLLSLLPALEPAIMSAEEQGQAELQALIAQVQSPWLKDALSALDGAVDAFLKAEIAKI